MSVEMKDSGVKWIGMIPENWKCCKQKYVLQLINGRAYSDSEFETDGKYRILRVGNLFSNPIWYTSSLELDEDKYCSAGDLLYSWSMSYSPVIWQGDKVIYHYHIWKVKPNRDVDKKFAFYYLNALTSALQAEIHETTMGFITMGVMNKSYIAFPELIEQEKIASFLDTQCVEIEAIITRTRESIGEYKKLRQATVDQAVTHGIRSKRKLKSSGLKWVQEIPEEWDAINPKALFSQRKDRAVPGEKQLTASQQHGVIFQDEYMAQTGSRVVVVQKDFDILKHVEAGDFVISMRSFQGGLEYSTRTGSISSAYVMLIPNTELVYPRFFRWLLKSSVYINALQSTSNLVRDGQAMRYSNFAQVRLYTLPLKEQEEIADYLDRTCSEIDTLIAKKEQYLVELENYKKSLIYEYVTGKKEVR